MKKETLEVIRNNPIIYQYLRDNSSWYKELNRNSNVVDNILKEAKKYYKVRGIDRLERAIEQIDMITTFMDVLK